jgi:hypothetical protein
MSKMSQTERSRIRGESVAHAHLKPAKQAGFAIA